MYLQVRSSLADNVDFSKPQERIAFLNTKWKVVQGGVESHSRNLQECYQLLGYFEENARKMRSWTFESDLSQVKNSPCIHLFLCIFSIPPLLNLLGRRSKRKGEGKTRSGKRDQNAREFALLRTPAMQARKTALFTYVYCSLLFLRLRHFVLVILRRLVRNLTAFKPLATIFYKHTNNCELSYQTNKSNGALMVKPRSLLKSGMKYTTEKNHV